MNTQDALKQVLTTHQVKTQGEIQKILMDDYKIPLTISGVCVALKKLKAVKDDSGFYSVDRPGVVKFKLLHENAKLPVKKTKGAAGYDISCIADVRIYRGSTTLIKTGLAVQIPEGYEMQTRPRSGHALKAAMILTNSPGTIDCDYRGEVGILASTLGDPIQFKAGDHVAQAVFAKLPDLEIELVDDLNETERGSGGYGSTDV